MKPIYRSSLFMLTIIIGQLIGSFFVSGFLQRVFTSSQFLVATQVLFLLVPVLLYLLVIGMPINQTLKLNKISIIDILIVIAIALFAQPVASFFALISSFFFEDTVSQVVKGLSNISYLKQLGIIALTPAICEELTMRGVILSGYDKVSRGKAAVVTGLFFGILHMNPQQFLYAFVLGIIFAYLVRITNSLFSTIICHFTFNGIQVTMMYLASRVNPEVLNETSSIKNISVNQQVISVVSSFAFAIAAAYIIIRLIKYLEVRHSLNNGWDKDNYIYEKDSYAHTYSESRENFNAERIINGPFIAVILIYLAFMVFLWNIS
jgi:membrane protease YdiL (CAAX protease family)